MFKTQKVFTEETHIETQTIYSENGKINIYPCVFEESHTLVARGGQVRQKGLMVTADDGTSCFRPYAVGSGRRYNLVFRTEHGVVKETRNDLIVQLHFPKEMGKSLIAELLQAETDELAAFIQSRKCKIKKNR